MANGGVVFNFLVKADQARRDVLNFAGSLSHTEAEADALDAALDGMDRELDSIGAAARNIASDMGSSSTAFDNIGDEAETAAGRLRRAADDMADGIQSGAHDIDRTTDGMRADLGETGKEAGAEFVGNIAEGIGSGQTNLNDIVSGTLGGLTNLTASMSGPVGVAAGVAAAGIGLVFSAVKGEAEKAKAKIDELRGALEDVGDLAGEEAKKAIFKTWIDSAKETTGKLENVNDALQTAGVSAEDFQDALAGDPAKIEKVRTQLQAQGGEIIKNEKSTGRLTAEQKKYMETFPTILQDIHANDDALGAVRREHDAIKDLSGDTAKNAKKTGDNLDTAADKAGDLSDELDKAAKPRTVSLTVALKKGQTVSEWINDQYGRSATVSGASAAPMNVRVVNPEALAAPTPYTAPTIVTDEQIYRAVSRLIMRGDARNGRGVVRG